MLFISFPTSSAVCILNLARFGYFTMEHIREIFPPHSPQLPSENSHGFASEALSLLLVEGGANNHALHGDVGDGGKAWLFHVFPTFLSSF